VRSRFVCCKVCEIAAETTGERKRKGSKSKTGEDRRCRGEHSVVIIVVVDVLVVQSHDLAHVAASQKITAPQSRGD
jgi:hypothetical protein